MTVFRASARVLHWVEPVLGRALGRLQGERTIKAYPRRWKLNLIEADNPEWEDLYERLNG